jgi:hypothetical protein
VTSYSAGTAPPRGPRSECAHGTAGSADAGREGATAPPHKAGWTVRITAAIDFADIPPNYLKMLLVLERACRDRSYCWNSNASLAAMYGAENSGGFRRLLAHMRRDGYIAMVPVNPDRPGEGRVGIFLLKRLDPDLPVEDRPPPREAVARLWAARERKGEPVRCPTRVAPPAPIEATPLPRMSQPPLPQMGQQNNDGSLKKDEKNDDGVVVAPSRSPDQEDTPEQACDGARNEGEESDDDVASSRSPDAEEIPEKAPEAVVAPPPSPDEEKAPAKAPEDLGPLVARAHQRFGGCMHSRVAEVVKLYGRNWVEVVLWGVLTLRDWGGVLATLGHWKREGGPTDRAVERARREQAKAAPKPVMERRPAAERPPAEVLLAEIRRGGFRLEIGAENRLELIDPEPLALEGPRSLVERLRKQYEASVQEARAEFRSRLDGLGAEVISLLRSGPPDRRGSAAGVAVAEKPCPSGGGPIVAPWVGTG